jgi:hypothetical protein
VRVKVGGPAPAYLRQLTAFEEGTRHAEEIT